MIELIAEQDKIELWKKIINDFKENVRIGCFSSSQLYDFFKLVEENDQKCYQLLDSETKLYWDNFYRLLIDSPEEVDIKYLYHVTTEYFPDDRTKQHLEFTKKIRAKIKDRIKKRLPIDFGDSLLSIPEWIQKDAIEAFVRNKKYDAIENYSKGATTKTVSKLLIRSLLKELKANDRSH